MHKKMIWKDPRLDGEGCEGCLVRKFMTIIMDVLNSQEVGITTMFMCLMVTFVT